MIDSIQNDQDTAVDQQAAALMEEYRRVIERSEHMVQRAQAGEWDALVSEGMDYLLRADELSALGDMRLSFSQRRERQVYLQRLLDNDRKIRERLDGRLKELGTLMAEEAQQISSRAVSSAYQRFSGH